MDGDYDYDGDEIGDYDDDWLYVEDDFALSDELAENQFASPGYAGTNWEISLESYEFELYAFWDDLEYADDAYWEYESPHPMTKDSSANVQKRKRSTAKANISSEKRRKTVPAPCYEDFAGQNDDPVLFRSRKERDDRFLANPPLLEEREPLAFLSDWRERFAHVAGLVSSKPMPVDMKEAADGDAGTRPDPSDTSSNDNDDAAAAAAVHGDDDGDIESTTMQDTAAGAESQLADIDPEMLKAVLRQKLGDSVLQDMDENMLLQILTQMISGDEDADEATGSLASSLLDKATKENGDERLTGWLSQQGVFFQDEDDDSSVAAESLSTQSAADAHPSLADSAVRPTNSDRASHSNSTRKRKALPEPGGSTKRSKSSTLQESKLTKDKSIEPQTGGIHLTSMEENTLADGSIPIADDPGSAAGILSDPNTRKRKASEIDMHASHTVKTKRSKQVDKETSEPTSATSPVSKRTRSTKTKGG